MIYRPSKRELLTGAGAAGVLSPFVIRNASAQDADLAQALALSGHFLEVWLAPTLAREKLPDARPRAAAALLRTR